MPPGPGDQFGRYVLEELLGKGGMGEVYRARDTLLERRVALKMLIPPAVTAGDAPVSTDGGARILREARAAARITHPNAVAIFDVGEVDGVAFLAMELVRGRSLRSFVGDASIPVERRVRWLVDVARGLAAAHELGIVHRDMKPDNVIVCTDGTAKVLDFGIARKTVSHPVSPASTTGKVDVPSAERIAATLGTLTAQGIIVGTPLYMAPEQMRGDALDGHADQFSWGVLAHEVLIGKVPWRGTGLVAIAQILAEDVTSLHEKNPAVPKRVDEIVRRALSKSPGARFGSMKEIADELEGFAAPAGELEGAPVESMRRPSTGVTSESIALARTEESARLERGVRISASMSRTPSKKAGRFSTGRAVAVAVAIVGVIAVGGVAVSRSHTVQHAKITAVDAGEALSEMSANPEATSAYRAGMTALHGGAMGAAHKQLARSIELDPLFAAAHLRRALLSALRDGTSTSDFQEDIQRARNARSTLGEHDRLLLNAFEPWTAVPPDLVESSKRLEAAERLHPSDADFPFQLGVVLDGLSRPSEALAAFSRAVERDPTFALAWYALGPERLLLDDSNGAMNAYRQCVAVAPGGTSCLSDLVSLEMNEGKCDDLVVTSRRLITLEPSISSPYEALASGLLGSDQPMDSVRAALGQQWEHESPEERRASQVSSAASLAILGGDFAAAESAYLENERLSASAPEDYTHFASFSERALLALEEGRNTQAAQFADLYLRGRSAWSSAGSFDWTIAANVIELEAGRLDRAHFETLRGAWIERNKNVGNPSFNWIEAYARAVGTPEDAATAIAAKPDVRPLMSALSMTPRISEPIGRTYLLAGKLDEAVRYLSQAAAACPTLHMSEETIVATRAALELGQALQEKADKIGACAAYARVIRRWGSTKPMSRTATAARIRSEALGCAP